MKSKVGAKAYRSIGGNIGTFIFLLIIALFMLLPLVFVVSSAFKPLSELFIFPPKLFPMNPTLDNFKDLSSLLGDSWLPFSRYVFNSLAVTVIGTFGNIIFSSMAAYVLSKHDFPGKNILFHTVVLSLLFSTVVTGIPNYIIITKLHMINTVWALILPLLPSSLGLFLMKQFMDQMIPDTLLEAARLDGAGENRIFFSICLPLVKPAIMTLLIYSFQGIWNSTGGSYIFDEKLKTLPTALNNIITSGISRTGVSSAVSLLLILPPIAVFLFAQSNVLQTMATSGMKD
ncbi:MAG: carbohydrate ABC transporter permease [Acutalibacteraceae bacterium]